MTDTLNTTWVYELYFSLPFRLLSLRLSWFSAFIPSFPLPRWTPFLSVWMAHFPPSALSKQCFPRISYQLPFSICWTTFSRYLHTLKTSNITIYKRLLANLPLMSFGIHFPTVDVLPKPLPKLIIPPNLFFHFILIYFLRSPNSETWQSLPIVFPLPHSLHLTDAPISSVFPNNLTNCHEINLS